MSDLPTIAFAGIGLMGLPMCRRLLAAGYRLVVWNRSSEKCQPLVDLGARAVATPPSCAPRPMSCCFAGRHRRRARGAVRQGASPRAARRASCWSTIPAWNPPRPGIWRQSWSFAVACAGSMHRSPAALPARSRHAGDHGWRPCRGCRAGAADSDEPCAAGAGRTPQLHGAAGLLPYGPSGAGPAGLHRPAGRASVMCVADAPGAARRRGGLPGGAAGR